MSSTIKWLFATALLAIVVACVTINVYFPEAAAERAADRFIRDIIGSESLPEPAPDSGADSGANAGTAIGGLASAVVGWVIPSAHAQSPDIDIDDPQINAIKDRMAERHRQHLAAWYDTGAIGLDNSGLIAIRDRSAVGLSERRELEQVVADENADRRAVYREIAVANDHPEWEAEIRDTFARRWVANARSGWYYQEDSGDWQRK